jgi:hypothetical protein
MSLNAARVSAAAATITVDSAADTNTRDAGLTLREAMLLATGGLAVSALTVGECDQVSASSFAGSCSTTDTIGAGSGDTIGFSAVAFQAEAPSTITLGSTLPSLVWPGDTVSGFGEGVIVDGVTTAFDCFSIDTEAGDNNAIRALEIRRCQVGILIGGNSDFATIGGLNAAESGGNCSGSADDDADGYRNDGCPASGAREGNKCADADNDDGGDDALINDGCPAFGAAESVCTGAVDNDSDGLVNDGCPQSGSASEGGTECRDSFDDDGDTLVNDGCLARGDGNIISANDEGIRIQGASTTTNTVQGNLIGTDFDGQVDTGNTGDGIEITSSPDNVVGGDTAEQLHWHRCRGYRRPRELHGRKYFRVAEQFRWRPRGGRTQRYLW